jgi:acyl-CoA dehydrogenase
MADVAELRDRVRAFVRDVVIPMEERDVGGHGLDDGLRQELQAAARAAGVFAPQVPVHLGGLGLDMRGAAVVFEEAGYSILGPQALNCAAPDEGTCICSGSLPPRSSASATSSRSPPAGRGRASR